MDHISEMKWSRYHDKIVKLNILDLVVSLFHQMCGYLPESTYNLKTRQILDEFYPRALQFCSTQDIPDDLVNIDICKWYPSVLLNNENAIPIYSIHDTIEKFKDFQDLGLTGEFYIDEYNLEKFDCEIKIEAGFYSSNLVNVLHHYMNMPLSNIKYQITIEYVFDNFPEDEAKILVNNFIGNLGLKYTRNCKGFVCKKYDTVC